MKKALILMLALLMIVMPVLCACGGDDTTSDTESKQTTSDTSESQETDFPLEKKNFGGTTITVLARPKHSSQQFCPNEEYEGSVINQAVSDRNQYIEENFGLILEVEEVDRPATEIITMIESNIDDYDLVCDSVCRMLPAVVDSVFYSLNDDILLTQPYWEQNANEYLTLSDRVFFVTGDALFMDDLHTSAVLFNKDLWNQHYQETEGSPYDMVKNGTWTLDKLNELAKGFSQPDENGNWGTPEGMYGIVTDGYTGATHLTAGSNIMTASKDENGNLTLHVGDERSIKAFDKVYNMLNDETIALYVEKLKGYENTWGTISNMFINNHALFYVCYINSLMNIKENESPDKVDPGVLPIPMYDENQKDEGYFDGINIYQCEVLGIPTCNNKRYEETCYMLEALGYYRSVNSPFGKECVTYAVYETTMKLQSVTNQDDADMMDYILSHRLYDLGGIFDWGKQLTGAYSFCLYGGQNNLVSKWDSIKDSVQMAMEETITAYKNSIA